jgi:hypothetical protein
MFPKKNILKGKSNLKQSLKTIDSFFIKKTPPQFSQLQNFEQSNQKIQQKMEIEPQLPAQTQENRLSKSLLLNPKSSESSEFNVSTKVTISLPKHLGGRPSLSNEMKWNDLCSKVQKKYPLQFKCFKFNEGRKIECNKCHTILQNKRLKILRVSEHLKTTYCKEFKTSEEKEKIKQLAQQQKDKQRIPTELLCELKSIIGVYEKIKNSGPNSVPKLKEELTELHCNTLDWTEREMSRLYLKTLNNMEQMAMISMHNPGLLQTPTYLNFEKAEFVIQIKNLDFLMNPYFLKAYLLFHQKKSYTLKTEESVKEQLKVVEDFLSDCFRKKKTLNGTTILSYLHEKEYEFTETNQLNKKERKKLKKKYQNSTKKGYLSILNNLLPPGEPKARFKRQRTFKEELRRITRSIPKQFQIQIFETLKKKSKHLYDSAHLLKYGGVRVTEIVYLRRRNLVKVEHEGEETTYWLVYRQSKTGLDKAVIIPEKVFKFYEGFSPDAYLVNYRTADSYRKAYRTALLDLPFARLYTPHSWRHTGAGEILLKSKQSGFEKKEGLLLAKWFLGHENCILLKEEGNLAYYDQRALNTHPFIRLLKRIEGKDPLAAEQFLRDDQMEIIRRKGKGKFLELETIIPPKEGEMDTRDLLDLENEKVDLELMSTEVWKHFENHSTESEDEETFGTLFPKDQYQNKPVFEKSNQLFQINLISSANIAKNEAMIEQILNQIEETIENKRRLLNKIQMQIQKQEEEEKDQKIEKPMENIMNFINTEDFKENLEFSVIDKPNHCEDLEAEPEVHKFLYEKKDKYENLQDLEGYDIDPYSKLEIPRNRDRDDGPIIQPISKSSNLWKFTESDAIQKERVKWSKYIVKRKENDQDDLLNEVYGRNIFSSKKEEYNWPVALSKIPCCVCEKTKKFKEKMLQCRTCDNLCHIECEQQKRGMIVFMDLKHYWLCSDCSTRSCMGQVESFVGFFDSYPYQNQKQAMCTTKHLTNMKNLKLHPNMQTPIGLDAALEHDCLKFNDDLVYSFCNSCNEDICAENKGEIFKLNQKNLEVYRQFKEKTRLQQYVPVKVQEFKHPTKDFHGYSVVALEDIEEGTIIGEYSGNVIL